MLIRLDHLSKHSDRAVRVGHHIRGEEKNDGMVLVRFRFPLRMAKIWSPSISFYFLELIHVPFISWADPMPYPPFNHPHFFFSLSLSLPPFRKGTVSLIELFSCPVKCIKMLSHGMIGRETHKDKERNTSGSHVGFNWSNSEFTSSECSHPLFSLCLSCCPFTQLTSR